ncbi:hypothetical protein I6E81_09865 [Salinibacterium sp. NG22]|uniref:hypothetical protein n=1 Tax=Salinibacterium sp. NG22 TaxID=2792040 RepID=UPI0018CDE560|nr:hypothetical protein [Salinibacterium sp. NG22]MBH0110472.1 hypothetical protein [Salinibacterium sp. NG22]
MTPFSSPASHFARWATAAYLSAGLLGANQFFFGAYGAVGTAPAEFPVLVTVVGAAVGVFAIVLLAFAVVMTGFAIKAGWSARSQPARETTAETAGDRRYTLDPPATAPLSRRTRLSISTGTVVAMMAVVTIGILNIFIWNPLTKAPGLTLDEIYAAMTAAGELGPDPFPWIWAIFWPLVALAFAGLTALPTFANIITVRGMLILSCVILSVAIFFHWFAGFSMGMGLADTFFVSGGDAASPGMLLSILGQLLAVAALFLAITPKRTNAGRLPEQTTRVVTN